MLRPYTASSATAPRKGLARPLGRDDDHAVGAAHTVDRRRSGVLQDVDPRHVLRRDPGERAAERAERRRHAVDHEQGLVVRKAVSEAAWAPGPERVAPARVPGLVVVGLAS